MATAEEQLSIKVTSEGLKENTKDLRELEASVTEASTAVARGGKQISISVTTAAGDIRKAAGDIVAAVDRVHSSNTTAFQGLSSDVKAAAASIQSSLDQIKASNEASSRAVVDAVERMGAAMNDVAQKYKESSKKIKEESEAAGEKALGLKDTLGSLAAAWAGTAAARAFIGSTLEAAASMESLEKAFKAAGGTIEQFEEVKEMAANTPVIDAQAAVSAVSTLARMGYSIDEAKGKVQTLANAAAYFGKSSADMERAMVQIEQLAGKTTGFSGDLLAISNTLRDVKQRLNQAFGTETVEQIQELGVTGQEVAEKLIKSYETLPEISAGTQEGLDQLGASFMEIRAELGKAFIPALQLTASVIGKVANGIKSMPDWAKTLTAWAIAGGAVAIAVYNIVKAVNAARRAWQGLITLQALSQALKGPAGIAAVVAGTAVAVGGMALTNAYLNKKHKEDEAKGASEDDAAIAAIRQEAAANVSGLEASTKPQAAAAKADKDAAKEAAKALKDSEKEKTKALKDAEKERADALKAAEKAQKQHEKQMADAAKEVAKEQQKAYAETEAALKKQQQDREALAQKAEETARRVKEAVIGATAKGQVNLASTSMWSQADNAVYSIGSAGAQPAQKQAVEIKEAFRAVQTESNDRYFAENNTLLKSIYNMLSQISTNMQQQNAVKLPTGR